MGDQTFWAHFQCLPICRRHSFSMACVWQPACNRNGKPAFHGKFIFSCGKKKIKSSHTRYRLLGPELIPVYRQSTCRWLFKSSPMAVVCHYFLPGLQSPSQPKSVTVLRPVPSYTACWQRHIGVNNLPKVVTHLCPVGNRAHDLLITSPTLYCYTTVPPCLGWTMWITCTSTSARTWHRCKWFCFVIRLVSYSFSAVFQIISWGPSAPICPQLCHTPSLHWPHIQWVSKRVMLNFFNNCAKCQPIPRFFYFWKWDEIFNKTCVKSSLHLKRVATLPCEMLYLLLLHCQ